eukprot:TRINITY_DN4979_c0_g1_i1.p1 TRINITY_DN4979_c0_g1~~TRINITY_DN4979_c0_g1_i1.p1  ORF type:complete len:246 (-),score=53.61 TRINITY_DN4979_c0_g1_i1:33-770(-)
MRGEWFLLLLFVFESYASKGSALLSNGRSMHYLTNNLPSNHQTSILLIHGGDRKVQNSKVWSMHESWLDRSAQYFAVDLLGHGNSTIQNEKPSYSVQEQADSLSQLIKQKIAPENNLIILGRSYGGRVGLELASLIKKESVHPKLNGLVFIAPSIDDAMLKNVDSSILKLPSLFIWAEDDPIVPFQRSNSIVPKFENSRLVPFGKLLKEGMEKWRAHVPENEKPEKFQDEVSSFLSKLKSTKSEL